MFFFFFQIESIEKISYPDFRLQIEEAGNKKKKQKKKRKIKKKVWGVILIQKLISAFIILYKP